MHESVTALATIRRLGSAAEPDRASKVAQLLRLGAVEHLTPLLGCGVLALARPAALALVALVATADAYAEIALHSVSRRGSTRGGGHSSRRYHTLAAPFFFRAARTALLTAGAASGAESVAACVSLLLQRLSCRKTLRALFDTSDLRGTILSILHAGSAAAMFESSNTRGQPPVSPSPRPQPEPWPSPQP